MQTLRHEQGGINNNGGIINNFSHFDSDLFKIAQNNSSHIDGIIGGEFKNNENDYAIGIAIKLSEIIENLILQGDLENGKVITRFGLTNKPSFLNELNSLYSILKTKITLDGNSLINSYEDFYKLNSTLESFFIENKDLIINIFNNLGNKDSLIKLIKELNEKGKNIARDFPNFILNPSSIH